MRKKICRIKRGLAVMLSVCMVFGVAPIQAGAEENDSEIAVQAIVLERLNSNPRKRKSVSMRGLK